MKTENLKVAVFPIGSVIRFKKEKLKRSDGTSEYYKLIWGLARNPNIAEVWLLQNNDFRKLTSAEKIEFDPRGVVRDVYNESGMKFTAKNEEFLGQAEEYKLFWDGAKDLGLPDFGIGFSSQGLGMVNIPNLVPSIREPNKKTSVLNMTYRYGAPVIHYLNNSNIPWFLILTDPRYIKKNQKWRDMVNGPKEGIAQYTDMLNLTHFNRYPDLENGEEITEPLQITYSGIEKLNLVGETVISPDTERDIKFSVVAMQSSYGAATSDYRLDELKKWILDRPNSSEFGIYGKWDERFSNQYPSNFLGYRTPEEIDEVFKKTRYTLIIPIRPHWVTSKYAEMLRVGVVPFFHPHYDTQFSTLPADHYLRVKTPQEMFDKIAEMEANPELRIKIVKELQVKFLLGVRRGEFLSDLINPFLERANVPVRMVRGYSDEVLRQPEPEDPIERTVAVKETVKAKSLF